MDSTYQYQRHAGVSVGGPYTYNQPQLVSPSRGIRHLSFLGLPAVVRARVYTFLPQAGFGYVWQQATRRATIGDHTIPELPAIARTCRALRREILPAYYRDTVFHFWISGSLSRLAYAWLHAQEEFAISCIEKIGFESLTVHYDACHFARCAATAAIDCAHGKERTSLNCVKHQDKIVVNVPGRIVLVEPTTSYKFTEKKQTVQYASCVRCDHNVHCEAIAMNFRDILMRLDVIDGVPRMSKGALHAMLRLAIGDGSNAGMSRPEVFVL